MMIMCIVFEQVRQVFILKYFREKEKEVGKDVILKDGREEEDILEREDRRRMDLDYGRMRFVLFFSMS